MCNEGDLLICVRGATTRKMNWAVKNIVLARSSSISYNNKFVIIDTFGIFLIFKQKLYYHKQEEV